MRVSGGCALGVNVDKGCLCHVNFTPLLQDPPRCSNTHDSGSFFACTFVAAGIAVDSFRRLRGGLLAGGAIALRLLLTPQSRLNPVGLTLVQALGPLRDSRRADATCDSRRCDRSTKHFDCGFLFHKRMLAALQHVGKPSYMFWQGARIERLPTHLSNTSRHASHLRVAFLRLNVSALAP